MAGKISGALGVAALVGGLLFVAAPSQAVEGGCGPVTLDQLFPWLDAFGSPVPTTTSTTAPPVEAVGYENDAEAADPTSTTAPAPTETTDSAPTTGSEDTTTTTTVADTTTTTEDRTTTTTTTTAPPSSSTTTAPSTTTTAPDSGSAPKTVCKSWIYEMEWPLGVDSSVFSGFGADRDGGARKHEGNDIVGPKLAPVVAVADGVVTSVHSTPPGDCCWLMLTHDDGWQSLYVHLNNDSYLTDDGLGHGVRPGLEVGTRVEAGEVIGWIGDSGNAEATVPHLHFELRHPDGYSVDPNSSLEAAKADLDLPSVRSPYLDLDGMALGQYASSLLTEGIFWPCDDRGLFFCPTRLAQPDEATDLLEQLTGLTAPVVEGRQRLIRLQDSVPDDRLPSVIGCSLISDCLEAGITEGDVARLALWANLAQRGSTRIDSTPNLSQTDAVEAEMGLRILGRIAVCHPTVDDTTLLSRAEVAGLLLGWVLGEGQTSCLEDDAPTS